MPGVSRRRLRQAWSSSSLFPVRIRKCPPPGMASLALVARFIRTWANWPGSALMGLRSGARSSSISIILGMVRSSSFSVSRITSFRSLGLSSGSSLRLKVRIWVTRSLPLAAALRISLIRPRSGFPASASLQGQLRVADHGRQDVVEVVGDAPARVPRASIFWAW